MRYLGIVEGFYGRCWSWQARQAYPEFMQAAGLNAYIYAPKSDDRLRHCWRELWPSSDLDALKSCAAGFQRLGIRFGVGLSPLGLTASEPDAHALSALDSKLEQIDALGCDLICVLFDDMPSDGSVMARRQLRVLDYVRSRLAVQRYIICPSYYTTDPVLEKLFGPRPQHYWSELASGLDDEVDYFWTGEQVCSKHYSEDNLQYIGEQFRKPPVIWDNYPVNDGEKLSRYLNIRPPLERRDSGLLLHCSSGLFANPMNQAFLSQLPLATLALQYADEHSTAADIEAQWLAFMQRTLGTELAAHIQEDSAVFQTRGLDNLSVSEKHALCEKYRRYEHETVLAKEIVDWLEEKYRFDPACLTG